MNSNEKRFMIYSGCTWLLHGAQTLMNITPDEHVRVLVGCDFKIETHTVGVGWHNESTVLVFYRSRPFRTPWLQPADTQTHLLQSSVDTNPVWVPYAAACCAWRVYRYHPPSGSLSTEHYSQSPNNPNTRPNFLQIQMGSYSAVLTVKRKHCQRWYLGLYGLLRLCDHLWK